MSSVVKSPSNQVGTQTTTNRPENTLSRDYKKPAYLSTTIGRVKAVKSPVSIVEDEKENEYVGEDIPAMAKISKTELDLEQMVRSIGKLSICSRNFL